MHIFYVHIFYVHKDMTTVMCTVMHVYIVSKYNFGFNALKHCPGLCAAQVRGNVTLF